jgi:uncharacterized membrane protein (DUF485 family)
MHHQPASHVAEKEIPGRTRLGLIFFAVYFSIYVLYVLLNAFYPEAMDSIPFGGVNLAILYGLGLIGAAFVLALLYGWMCRTIPDDGRSK